MQKVFVTGGSGFVGRELLVELRRRGVQARALARSDGSAATVARLGAAPVRGDLDDVAAMAKGMAGCDVVVHCAAYVEDSGPREAFFQGNVQGTANVLAAAREAGVKRFVHVGTEAVLADGRPLVRVNEDAPYPAKSAGLYPLTKGLAERAVREANGDGLETVVVRPRFIWGKGDTSLVPKLREMVKQGRFRWIGGGRHLTSTCHVANVVEGILCAADRGKPGGVYFLTDGEPVEMRRFLTDMLNAAGIAPGDKSVPLWLARALARAMSFMTRPPLSVTAVALIGQEVTVDDARARKELGYQGKKSIAQGLEEMRA